MTHYSPPEPNRRSLEEIVDIGAQFQRPDVTLRFPVEPRQPG